MGAQLSLFDDAANGKASLCAIAGCDGATNGRRYCAKHYHRFYKHGDPLLGRNHAPRGAPLAFVKQACTATHDACIDWPFGQAVGYGSVHWNGRQITASRLVCFLVYGDPPTPQHEAAHNCGRRICINPKHLRWATRAENNADKYLHGTAVCGSKHPFAVLTEADIPVIRRLLDSGQSCPVIARAFGVKPGVIQHIKWGQTWNHV